MSADCLEWEGRRDRRGYGRLYDATRKERVYAHVATYEAQYGPVPGGWDVHHECENKSCVNSHHLQSIPKGSHTSQHFKKEFCKRGHLLAGTRRVYPDGSAACTKCRQLAEQSRSPRDQREYCRQWRLRQKGRGA